MLLHLRRTVEGLYFHCSLSVCVCVCMSVCLWVDEITVKWIHWFWCGFCWMVAYHTGSDFIKIGDAWSKVKVTVTENVFQDNEKIFQKFKCWYILKFHFDTKYDYCKINHWKNLLMKIQKVLLIKKKTTGMQTGRYGSPASA